MSGEPYIVWIANQPWEDPGTDRRLTKEMERYARILWVDPPISPATRTQRRFGARRTIRPMLSPISENVTRLRPTALPGMRRFGVWTTTGPLVRAQVRWALRRTGIQPFAVVSTTLESRWAGGAAAW